MLREARAPRARRTTSPLVVVVNGRASRAGDAEQLLADVTRHVAELGFSAVGRLTSSEDELGEVLDGSASARVVLVGGDGTLSCALNLGVALPEVALVPAGRANNVARALGLPRDVARAARLAARAPARPIDVLRVETDRGTLHCVEGVSAGFQAAARSRYEGGNSGDLRAGARAFVSALRDYRPYPVDLLVDGRARFQGEGAQVFLSNLPFFGFGFRVDPVARPSDGLLEAIVMEAGSRPSVARLLVSTYRGTHLARPDVSLSRGREAVIRSPLPLACDAQPLDPRPACVTVAQGLLRVAS